MDIQSWMTADEQEPFGIVAKGHHDLKEFWEAARSRFGLHPEDEEGLRHTYLVSRAPDENAGETIEGPVWEECTPDTPGAEPFTAILYQ